MSIACLICQPHVLILKLPCLAPNCTMCMLLHYNTCCMQAHCSLYMLKSRLIYFIAAPFPHPTTPNFKSYPQPNPSIDYWKFYAKLMFQCLHQSHPTFSPTWKEESLILYANQLYAILYKFNDCIFSWMISIFDNYPFLLKQLKQAQMPIQLGVGLIVTHLMNTKDVISINYGKAN